MFRMLQRQEEVRRIHRTAREGETNEWGGNYVKGCWEAESGKKEHKSLCLTTWKSLVTWMRITSEKWVELGLIRKCFGKTRRREGEDSKLKLFYFNFTITAGKWSVSWWWPWGQETLLKVSQVHNVYMQMRLPSGKGKLMIEEEHLWEGKNWWDSRAQGEELAL